MYIINIYIIYHRGVPAVFRICVFLFIYMYYYSPAAVYVIITTIQVTTYQPTSYTCSLTAYLAYTNTQCHHFIHNIPTYIIIAL